MCGACSGFFLYICLLRIFELTASLRRKEVDKDLEILVLRHQLRVLRRQLPCRVAYRPADRARLDVLGRWTALVFGVGDHSPGMTTASPVVDGLTSPMAR
jgi:hypothetical protein